jgi:hypothetical protein
MKEPPDELPEDPPDERPPDEPLDDVDPLEPPASSPPLLSGLKLDPLLFPHARGTAAAPSSAAYVTI